jgi:hypothetical protein
MSAKELKQIRTDISLALAGKVKRVAEAIYTERRIETIFLSNQAYWLEYLLDKGVIDLKDKAPSGQITIQFAVPRSPLDMVTLPEGDYRRLPD